ncbi:peptidoglycan-binding protein [Methylobacterium longum]|uniref:Peptidoglycan-binding protein n=1 Tax=Methylobacterium longum TaxID=767694 RepID=A0ABT8APH1_9HYPH|nr:peptidoglycan-binding protein [Methylobacterium longum]MDN3571793.1 peptidoglycan-binding protein [Methylobacterium longum]GJE13994.1 hypothetical protein FOHLNKBM_5063 [Methylobacterium longum]
MISLPFWATTLISFIVKLVTHWQANLRAEQALRELGAATQADASVAAAEKQEASARAAGDAAADGPDDDRDILPELKP